MVMLEKKGDQRVVNTAICVGKTSQHTARDLCLYLVSLMISASL